MGTRQEKVSEAELEPSPDSACLAAGFALLALCEKLASGRPCMLNKRTAAFTLHAPSIDSAACTRAF